MNDGFENVLSEHIDKNVIKKKNNKKTRDSVCNPDEADKL